MAREVQLIDDTGENHGLVSTQEALSRAEEAGLDRVEVGNSNPAVVKILKGVR